MNLQETAQVLENNNISIALDLGVHTSCDIQSNCPLAVELRKVIGESGITLAQLLEGYALLQEAKPEPIPYSLPQFEGKTTISIAGKDIEIDLTEIIEEQLGRRLRQKLEFLESKERQLATLGNSLYLSYLREIQRLRAGKTLPQLSFEIKDLLKAHCLITTDGTNYVFLFSRQYNPQWLVTRRMRYKLSNAHIKALRRSIFLEFMISKENKILNLLLLDSAGEKFQHYHGRGFDCWGQVKKPERWDRGLTSLTNITYQLMAALATINKDSLMQHTPPDMPSIDLLMRDATLLGEEGQLTEREQPQGDWTNATTPAPRWGRRRQ